MINDILEERTNIQERLIIKTHNDLDSFCDLKTIKSQLSDLNISTGDKKKIRDNIYKAEKKAVLIKQRLRNYIKP